MSVALDAIDRMIEDTVGASLKLADKKLASSSGLEMGTGIRLKILDEVKREVLRAECKMLEESGGSDSMTALMTALKPHNLEELWIKLQAALARITRLEEEVARANQRMAKQGMELSQLKGHIKDALDG